MVNEKYLFVLILIFENCVEMQEPTLFHGQKKQPYRVNTDCSLLSSVLKPTQPVQNSRRPGL